MALSPNRSVQLDVLLALLKPFVRFCLRHSHSVHDFEQMAKRAFLEIAEEEILKSTKKVNVSRLAVMTGMYRSEVTRMYREKEPPREEPMSILGRVIGQWRHDKRFTAKSGVPRTLTYRGEESEFKELCATVSTTINQGTLLFELKRLGYAKETKNGLKLLRQVFGFSSDVRSGFQLLARDIETLIIAAEENMAKANATSNLHIRTEYDNITPEELGEIRKWLLKEGKDFHKRARDYLSAFDKDVNLDLAEKEGGAQVALGAFAFAAPRKRI